jgi:hypothetical protein
VLEHLADDRKTLAAAARVCRAWFPLAVSRLWQEPPATEIDDVCSAERCRLYGRAVRLLAANEWTANVLKQYPKWSFPYARALRLEAPVGGCDSAKLARILRRCGPFLEDVVVGEAEELPYCVEAHDDADAWDTKVNDNVAKDRHEACMNYAALSRLARLPALRTLATPTHVVGAAMQRCLRKVVQPFAQLQKLAVPVVAAEVPDLVALMTISATLAELDLQILSTGRPPTTFIRSLAKLEHLRSLRIWSSGRSLLVAEDFMQLGGLACRLQKLTLDHDEVLHKCQKLSLTDEHVLAVVSHLPNLVELRINFESKFTGHALRLVGEHCRRLSVLTLHALFDLRALELTSKSVLFPHLTELHLFKKDYDNEMYVYIPIIASLTAHSPSDCTSDSMRLLTYHTFFFRGNRIAQLRQRSHAIAPQLRYLIIKDYRGRHGDDCEKCITDAKVGRPQKRYAYWATA